jgi:membrane associated rhomboid family serine protease
MKPAPPSFEAIHMREALVREEVLETFRLSARKWPPVSLLLVGACVGIHFAAVLLAPTLQSFTTNPFTLQPFYPEWENALMIFGARSALEITESGQYYRLLSCVFLHADILHLALNMVALFGLGRLCEATYGKARFLWLVVFSGLCGSILSLKGGVGLSVGASGSIFGLLGAGVVFGFRYRKELPSPLKAIFGRGLLPWVLLNIVIGLNVPKIDNLGHMGGLAGGAFLALIMGNQVIRGEEGKSKTQQALMAVSVGLLAFTALRMSESVLAFLSL